METTNFKYTVNGEEVVIGGLIKDEVIVVIPSHIKGLKVTMIFDDCFKNRKNLEEIFIPDGVEFIGDRTFFGCIKLNKIILPKNIYSIGENAFYGCAELREIYIPRGLKSLDESAFAACSSMENIFVDPFNTEYSSLDGILYDKYQINLIKCPQGKQGDVIVDECIIGINQCAFDGCKNITKLQLPELILMEEFLILCYCLNLTEIKIPGGVGKIPDYAFEDSKKLVFIDISDTVVDISLSAFNGCDSLIKIIVDDLNPNFSSKNGLLFNKKRSKLLVVPCGTSGIFLFPTGVTEIGEYAFDECRLLTEINISDSVIEIGDRAFGDCISLTRINIPQGVTKIGKDAFENCLKLESILVDTTNTLYSSSDGILFNKEKTELIRCPSGKIGSVTLLEGVVLIHEGAFRGCQKLSRVSIPGSVASIGKGAFAGCTGLDQDNLSEILNRGGEDAFTTVTN